ncbi:MAG: NADH:ubiquinone reductase (Na(+)-transporting) subunit D [Spirochaetes bacterium]|nr:NADH:ubiquinone reductase (Na(+)-transporting) subunit D [Spirochaetota bacterium]
MKNSKTTVLIKNNIWINNPVFVQILGICSTLAVTNNFKNTLIMAVSVTFVTAFSNFTVSMLKSFIPNKVRMIVQTLIISFYVIIVDIVLKAYMPDISKALGPYVGLVITNCIIMGRAEAFAQANAPIISFVDGFLSGIGYMIVLLPIALIRELLSFGTFYGYSILPENYISMTIMITAPSAFFMIAVYIWIAKSISFNKKGDKK